MIHNNQVTIIKTENGFICQWLDVTDEKNEQGQSIGKNRTRLAVSLNDVMDLLEDLFDTGRGSFDEMNKRLIH